MGKVTVSVDVWNVSDLEQLKRFTGGALRSLVDQVNGRISFQENIQARVVEFSFESTSIDYIVPHGLGYIPLGFVVINQNAAAILYSYKTMDRNNLYLRASAVTDAKILVF